MKSERIKVMANITFGFWVLLLGLHANTVIKQLHIKQHDQFTEALVRQYLLTSSVEIFLFAIGAVILSHLAYSRKKPLAAIGLLVLSAGALWKLRLTGLYFCVRLHLADQNMFSDALADWWRMLPVNSFYRSFHLLTIFFLMFSIVFWFFAYDRLRKLRVASVE